MLSEHLKPPLAFKEPHHPHQHSKGLAQVKKPLQHLSLEGIGRVADYVVTGRGLRGKEVLAGGEVRGGHLVTKQAENPHEKAFLRVKRAPYRDGPV